ncbi:tyrosine-type recombinase/integrase [Bacteroides ovatus]|nr:tyrosine-type recombinase/integrase [Bacteroides ovatus]
MLVILIFTVKVEKYVVYIFRKICVQKLRNGSKKKLLISGYIFLNRFGERITTRGIAQQLKHFAEKYGMNKEVVYPHSFRHRFAKNFLDRFNDLALLADLMGHESIETTRIYLRRTASEQQKIVDKVVNW